MDEEHFRKDIIEENEENNGVIIFIASIIMVSVYLAALVLMILSLSSISPALRFWVIQNEMGFALFFSYGAIPTCLSSHILFKKLLGKV